MTAPLQPSRCPPPSLPDPCYHRLGQPSPLHPLAPSHAALQSGDINPSASEVVSSVRPSLWTLSCPLAPDSCSPTLWLPSFPSKPWCSSKRQDPGCPLMDATQLSLAKGDGIRRAGGVARVPDMPTSVLGGLSCHVWF